MSNHKITGKMENLELFQSDLNNKSLAKNENTNSKKILYKDLKQENSNEKQILREMNENQIILDNCENVNLSYKVSNLTDLLYKLNYNTDIEKIIDTLNSTLIEQNKQTFDKNDFNIKLKKEELDKFSISKNIDEKFSLNLKYSLLCKNLKFNQ